MSVTPFPRGTPAANDLIVNQFTRAHDDSCEVAQNLNDSAGPGNYQVTNLVPQEESTANVAYPNPTILGREGYGYNNKQIDDDSRLRNNTIQAGRQRCPLHVQARPFTTVPFMGNGRGNADIESSILYPEFARTERPCNTISETFLDGQFVPLVPHLSQHIQNPSNLIPEVAVAGWIRGGIPSRSFMRDLDC